MAGPTYEQARDELVDVVRRLEAGGVTLEESLALWERGEALARTCQALLDGATARLDAASGDGGGQLDQVDVADGLAQGADGDGDPAVRADQ